MWKFFKNISTWNQNSSYKGVLMALRQFSMKEAVNNMTKWLDILQIIRSFSREGSVSML
jgi:hypothetical protein